MRRVLNRTRHWLLLAAILTLLASVGGCGGEAQVTILPATPTPTPLAD